MAKVIFDTETGVIDRELNDGDRVYSKEQVDNFKEREERKKSRGRMFSFADMDNVMKMKEEIVLGQSDLTVKDLGYFLVLQTYIDFDGVLYESSVKEKPMKKADIAKLLGISKPTALKLVNKLLKHEMLLETKVEGKKAFQINEKFHFRGHTKNKKLVKVFATKVREVYEELSPVDLGILYMVLPYIHHKTNVLCENPHETDVRKIEALSLTRLAELTGYTTSELSRRLNRMEFGDYIVFSKTIKQSKAHYTVNPLVFYRMDGEPRQDIVDTFLIQGK
jgi:predicted transcriptional regulator